MGWTDGEFTRVHDWTDDEANGYNIESSRMDEEDDNFESGINACLHKGGQNTPSADLPMGGRKHTGVGTGTDRDVYAAVSQVQDGSFKYNTTGGSNNVYTLDLTPNPPNYVTGQVFYFKANHSNSAAATLNVDNLGAKDIYVNGGATSSGDIVLNRVYAVVYDGTQFHLISGAGGGSGGSSSGAKIYLSSSHGFRTQEQAVIPFRSVAYDTDGYYTTGYSNLEPPATGRYRVTLYTSVTPSPVTPDYCTAYAKITLNGLPTKVLAAQTCGIDTASSINTFLIFPQMTVTWEGELEQGDSVQAFFYQVNGAGAELSLTGKSDVNSGNCTFLAIERIY